MKELVPIGKQLIMYGLVGALSSGIELSIMKVLISYFNFWYLYASIVVSAISLIISFSLRKIWVFKNRKKDELLQQLLLYILTLCSLVAINSAIVAYLVENSYFSPILSQFLAGLVSGLFGFIVNRTITFRHI